MLVYDEAQRAFDAAMVTVTHKHDTATAHNKSEPELFVEFADRVPEWCVVIGLIGTGQEIHVGEEAGIGQWRRAVEGSARWREWRIHTPPAVSPEFQESAVPITRVPALKHHKLVRDAFQLRMNAYRVLLTRARDATVLFVPSLPELDETFIYLAAVGSRVCA